MKIDNATSLYQKYKDKRITFYDIQGTAQSFKTLIKSAKINICMIIKTGILPTVKNPFNLNKKIMKNILLIMLILFSTNCFGQSFGQENICKSDFSKLIKLSTLHYDKNQNGKIEDTETLDNLDGYVVFIYNYNDSIHNELKLTIQIDPITRFNKTYKNIMFYNSNDWYIIKDKYNNIIFGTLPPLFPDEYYIVFVYDLLY